MKLVNEYRKKPVHVTASDPIHETNIKAIAAWCGGSIQENPLRIAVETLEGTMAGDLGHRIICGVAGEFYPIKPEIFDTTYELAP